ncbi:TOBE domain-containing protein [Propioniciclava coleopterorum]|uniref:TOBE domain-containing protein n=1 Tax=Propioniciclava coleopterorum TaxID=2714937 RepID=UPI003D702ABC
MAMSDRIAVMNAGVLHQLGAPREIYRRPATAFVARFIGRSNVLDGVVEGRDGDVAAVRLADGALLRARVDADSTLGDVTAGQEIAVSLRPESLALLGAAPAASDRAEGTLHGTVTLIEFTGSHCMIGLDLADEHGTSLLMTIPDTDDLPRVGDVVAVRPDPAKIWMVAR